MQKRVFGEGEIIYNVNAQEVSLSSPASPCSSRSEPKCIFEALWTWIGKQPPSMPSTSRGAKRRAWEPYLATGIKRGSLRLGKCLLKGALEASGVPMFNIHPDTVAPVILCEAGRLARAAGFVLNSPRASGVGHAPAVLWCPDRQNSF